jgi:plasmid stabilization system protein ParE
MPRVTLSERAFDDLERVLDFLDDTDPRSASAAVEVILDAFSILKRHPFVGRPVEGQLRELVISFGASGYVALYRVRLHLDRVEILALRHQREAGFG